MKIKYSITVLNYLKKIISLNSTKLPYSIKFFLTNQDFNMTVHGQQLIKFNKKRKYYENQQHTSRLTLKQVVNQKNKNVELVNLQPKCRFGKHIAYPKSISGFGGETQHESIIYIYTHTQIYISIYIYIKQYPHVQSHMDYSQEN